MKVAIGRQRREVARTLSLMGRTFALIWAATGWFNAIWLALLVLHGLIPAGIVYLTKLLVDGITAAMESGPDVSWDAALPVVVTGAVMAALLILQRLLSSAQNWISVYQSEHVQDHVRGLIHEKAARVDYGYYESAAYYDEMEQATGQAAGRTLSLLNNIGSLGQTTITLASFMAILVGYSWWLPLVLMISTLPALAIVLKHNREMHAWWNRTTATRRQAQYYDIVQMRQFSAAELRIYGFSEFFRQGYQELRRGLRAENLKLLQKNALANFWAGSFTFVSMGLTMVWIGLRALRGLATLGDLALFYQTFNQGQSLVSGVFRGLGQIHANTLYLEHLFRFLSEERHVCDPAKPVAFPAKVREGVEFENVTFAYPDTARYALVDFSLHIPAGKIVAIVGENGAGKSTFVKLLCRLYDPIKGRISIDGTDIRDFEQEELRRNISVMFQDPVPYQLTARNNILLADYRGNYEQDEIENAAKAAGAHDVITSLPHGYDTLLGRWFEHGMELSGGQWQRIALARAFLRQSPILVLDEPTSSMDSWAELDWMNRFRTLANGRTALIITHRFTTAMQADVIYVLHEGHVVETGTHSELLAMNGRYAKSWVAQLELGNSESAGLHSLV